MALQFLALTFLLILFPLLVAQGQEEPYSVVQGAPQETGKNLTLFTSEHISDLPLVFAAHLHQVQHALQRVEVMSMTGMFWGEFGDGG